MNKLYPRVLYFIAGMTPTDDETQDAAKYGPGVTFRNAALVADTDRAERCDGVAGSVPALYDDAPRAEPYGVQSAASLPLPSPVPTDDATALAGTVQSTGAPTPPDATGEPLTGQGGALGGLWNTPEPYATPAPTVSKPKSKR